MNTSRGITAVLIVACAAAVAAGPSTTRPTATSRPATRPTLAKPVARPQAVQYDLKPDAPDGMKKLWANRVKGNKGVLSLMEDELKSAKRTLTVKKSGLVTGTSSHDEGTAGGNVGSGDGFHISTHYEAPRPERYTYVDKGEKDAAIEKQQSVIDDMMKSIDEAKAAPVLATPLVTANMGDAGALDLLDVKQVTGDQDAIIVIRTPFTTDVWLTGNSTDGMVDGKAYHRRVDVYVSGTKRYGTASGGSKTLPMLTPFVWDQWLIEKQPTR